jgi:hypothetical protein
MALPLGSAPLEPHWPVTRQQARCSAPLYLVTLIWMGSDKDSDPTSHRLQSGGTNPVPNSDGLDANKHCGQRFTHHLHSGRHTRLLIRMARCSLPTPDTQRPASPEVHYWAQVLLLKLGLNSGRRSTLLHNSGRAGAAPSRWGLDSQPAVQSTL